VTWYCPGVLAFKSIIPVAASITSPEEEEKIPPVVNPAECDGAGSAALAQTGDRYEKVVSEVVVLLIEMLLVLLPGRTHWYPATSYFTI
jgi:hypothetical protein